MKFSTTAVILTAALGASAHPSGHAHMHRSIDKRGNFVMATRPTLPTVSEPAAEEPTTTTSSESSSTSSTSSSDEMIPFCSGNSKRVVKRATVAEIAYAGNLGAEGQYGCNLMMVPGNIIDKYDYTATFTNESGEDQQCVCFLKIGPTGLIDGFFNGNQALTFDLPAGSSKYLAAEENTQGGCSCGAGSVPLTNIGQFAGTWTEFDFANESNGGWSGADASCLVSAALGLDIPGLNICGHGTCSTINPGGTGTNAFLGGMEALDGLGLNIAPGKAHLDITVGYQG